MTNDSNQLSQRLFLEHLAALAPVLPVLGYLLVLLFDIGPGERGTALAVGVICLVLGAGVAPWWMLRLRVDQAFTPQLGDAPTARLVRILQLPRRTELESGFGVLLGVVGFGVWAVIALGRPAWEVLVGALLVAALNMFVGMRYSLRAEQVLLPTAVGVFHEQPSARLDGGWFYWPRLRWSLNFGFAAVLLCVLSIGAALVFGRGRVVLASLRARFEAEGRAELATALDGAASELVTGIGLPLLVLGAVLFVLIFTTARSLSGRYEHATLRLREAVDGLASGRPKLPSWVGTDEFGDLAFGVADVVSRLRAISGSLRTSAGQLADGAQQLGGSTGRQNETLTRQAAALQETEVTAQEIKQTSLLAAQKTEAVLKTAERAEEISRAGEGAIERSLSGLTDIRGEVMEMAARIKALGDRTRQIATITTAVKDLADQSNMLALNAAIEAARSGEHGKGFGVVAREIRSLADQSIQATTRVRDILEDVAEAVRSTVAITERGADKVQTSLVQVQSSGESLKELSGIVRDNAMAVRQIAAAVGQQNAGIGQIFEAVRDLSRMMDETIERLQATEGASNLVHRVADEVSAVVASYGVDDEAEAGDVRPGSTKAA